jgi:hypothetical protein
VKCPDSANVRVEIKLQETAVSGRKTGHLLLPSANTSKIIISICTQKLNCIITYWIHKRKASNSFWATKHRGTRHSCADTCTVMWLFSLNRHHIFVSILILSSYLPLGLLRGVFYSVLPSKISFTVLVSSLTYCMHHRSHSSWLDQRNIQRRVQTQKFFTIQFYPTPFLFLFSRSKHNFMNSHGPPTKNSSI